ncbi:MAG TPA: hypothetical protein VK623_06040 [Flavobacterium sp.]|nr:hypothetical protein [Flavobacterium sp.]
MKKLVLIFFSSMLLFSCGKDKKAATEDAKNVDVKEVSGISVTIEGIYEKDDSLSVVFKQNGYYAYNKAVPFKVKGSPLMQQLTINLPAGETVDNIAMMASSNKDQKYLTLKSIAVKNGDDEVVKNTDNFTTYFLFDECFKFDSTADGKSFRYVMDHTKKYQPGIAGSEQLEALLVK